MKFGIKKLDELLGKIEKGSVIVIEGVGDIPLILAKIFLKSAIDMGYKVFAMVPERVKRLLSDLKYVKVITPNDIYSYQELFTISLLVKKLDESVGLIDAFQQLLMLHEPSKVYQLFREVCQHIRDKSSVVIVTLDKRLADSKTLAMFESEADYVIDIDEVVKDMTIIRGIRVKKSITNPPSDYYKLELNGKKLDIGDKIEQH